MKQTKDVTREPVNLLSTSLAVGNFHTLRLGSVFVQHPPSLRAGSTSEQPNLLERLAVKSSRAACGSFSLRRPSDSTKS